MSNQMENKTVTIKVTGIEKEVEIRYWYNDARETEYWSTTSQVVLVKIGHGVKLWATSLQVFFDKNGKMTFKPMTVNNRNNLSLVKWNDLEKTDNKRSQHKGQYTK